MSLLRVDHLEKAFGGISAITELSFELPEGIVFSVIGPNGAGKTTLFNMLCGFYKPDHGNIFFKTKTIHSLLRLPSVIKEERKVLQQSLDALEFCHLDHLANEMADSLPYGDLKRLEIARALASKPRLLMLDEPAAGLNDTETQQMSHLIQRICDAGTTVLLVEHNMELVMKTSDQILVLNFGCLLAQGTPEQIQNNPAVIQAYLGGDS